MAVEFAPVAGKIKDSRGRDRTIQLKIGIDKDNPANPPYIVDAKDTNKILYQWNPTNKDWESIGSGSTILPISIPRGGIKPTYNEFLVNNKQMFTENTTVVINKFSDQQKEIWKESNTYQPFNSFLERQQQQSSLTGGQTPLPNPVTINDPLIKSQGSRESYDHYYYPKNIKQNKQDFIQFIAYEYVGRDLNVGNAENNSFESLGFGKRKYGIPKGSVTLPIQPSITDTNGVDWGGERINSLQAYAASVAYAGQEDIAGTGERVLKDIDAIFKSGSNSNTSNAVRLFLAGKAVGVDGLLSRVGGAVLNPNLELLFQGPQLRPFNFTFRLSPRDSTEAEQVKKIIRYFKQNMSVKNAEFNLFLKAPNVFQIKYHLAGDTNKDHPSLNRIKLCALQSCSVDYTPDGSYMTFNDAGATMTSYNLTLQFQELEPVTEKDYKDLNDINAIGY